MKITITKEDLQNGLQRVQNVVSNRTTLPVLSNVLFETTETGVRLTTTDLEVGIRCEIPAQIEKPGATTLPVKRLSAIVRELPAQDISLETDSKNISTIKAGGSVFKMFGLPKDEFPAFPSFKDAKVFTLKQKDLRDGLKKTAYAISVDETRYVLNGILFSFKENKLTMVATDGRRLALYDNDMEFPTSQECDFIVPTKAVTEVQRMLGEDGELTLSVSDTLVALDTPGTRLVSKLVEGNYPNYRQVIPGEAKFAVELDRTPFLEAVHRVSLLSNDKTSSVRLSFSKGRLDVSLNTPEVGEAKESLAIKYRENDFSIAFNPEFLMDPLRNLDNDIVFLHLIDEMSPGVIKINTPFLYVIMPMRVSS